MRCRTNWNFIMTMWFLWKMTVQSCITNIIVINSKVDTSGPITLKLLRTTAIPRALGVVNKPISYHPRKEIFFPGVSSCMKTLRNLIKQSLPRKSPPDPASAGNVVKLRLSNTEIPLSVSPSAALSKIMRPHSPEGRGTQLRCCSLVRSKRVAEFRVRGSRCE